MTSQLISEENNLIESLPEVTKKMRDEMAAWKEKYLKEENND